MSEKDVDLTFSYHVTESLKITNQNDVSRLYDVWSGKDTALVFVLLINQLKKREKSA